MLQLINLVIVKMLKISLRFFFKDVAFHAVDYKKMK